MITGFYDVFEQKLDRMKERLKNELGKDKSDRDKKFLKKELKEAKKLRNILEEMKDKMGRRCPHCGEKL